VEARAFRALSGGMGIQGPQWRQGHSGPLVVHPGTFMAARAFKDLNGEKGHSGRSEIRAHQIGRGRSESLKAS
jgi:hypothetical protein